MGIGDPGPRHEQLLSECLREKAALYDILKCRHDLKIRIRTEIHSDMTSMTMSYRPRNELQKELSNEWGINRELVTSTGHHPNYDFPNDCFSIPTFAVHCHLQHFGLIMNSTPN